MSAPPLDALLLRLNAGDATAADLLFRSYEPLLRMVVRRRISQSLRPKFDSTDVVQSVWADLVEGLAKARWKFQNARQLRAFLIKMTRNRLIDRIRQHRRALDREVSLASHEIETFPAARTARVSENFYADELWRQMLTVCPPAHYEILHLKRQGASLSEIAERTGLHPGSIRRILYDLARRVARLRSAGTPIES